MASPVNESLSAKRRSAGLLGAAARWGQTARNGKNGKRVPSVHGKPRDGETWYRIVNQADADAAEIYIYDEISWFWGITAKDFVDELKGITAATLNVYINSPGGDVFDGLAILNALRRHEATVNVVVDGLAASAASFIAMAGDTVTMSRNSQMMIHDALGIEVGNADDMRAFADLLDKTSQNIASIYADAAGGRGGSDDPDEWRALMRAETWMTDQEAVDLGLADRVSGAAGDDDEDEDQEPEDTAAAAAKNRFSTMLGHFKHRGREDSPAPQRSAAKNNPPPAPAARFDPDMFRKAVKEAAS